MKPQKGVLRREGDYWTAIYGGTTVRLRDAKGIRHLDELLRHPGRAFHVLDLFGPGGDAQARHQDEHDTAGVERIRKTVTNRIRRTLTRIRALHDALGLHLENSIRTGTHCTYVPERAIRWTE